MNRWDKLIEAACQAQDEFTLDELEAYADSLRVGDQLKKDEDEHGGA